ncbi:bidirectional sugar transporter SWEET3b-like [Dioscorea cayenensis subsp. rotundata]|uniref:Bidirectional sugar transporter SWEET n=1 Tax=Dioscorea cayennensis subsp. rotundata TaxID=55577 RepID=A0AB40BAQ6_DIOCR|nr:bidirectional sugar transporter SWEET3b-like [Dioscorea cayenensis subsp. rotundata]
MGLLVLLHFIVGVMGNAAALLLYTAPILTFKRVIAKRSTEEFSCIPYIIALFNCLLYTWYGFPVVSSGWENFLLITINGLGIIFELSFIFIYIWFSSAQNKKIASLMLMVVIAVSSITAFVSSFALHDHYHRKLLVGSVGLVASVGMYGSPLVAVKRVIKTKSVEFMPFYLSFFSCLASSLWLAYGFLGHDLFLAAPNILGSPMGLLQIILYCMYRKHKGDHEETDNKMDLEKNGVKFGSLEQDGNEKI